MSMESIDHGDALRDLMVGGDVNGAAALFERMLASAPALGPPPRASLLTQ
jgi:hypothetical protein